VNTLDSPGGGAREAVLVGFHYLPCTPSAGLHLLDLHIRFEEHFSSVLPDTGGGYPMGLRIILPHPAELGAPTGPEGHRHVQIPKLVADGVPCGIDRRRVDQGFLGLGKYLSEDLRLAGKELLNGPVFLILVARETRDGEVAYPVRAMRPTDRFLGDDMINSELDVFRPAVGAFPAPFFQQVLPNLVAEQRPSLVLDTADLRILEGLGVEPDSLDGDGGHGCQATELPRPGHDIVHPRHKGRREPSVGPTTVVEPWLTVSGLSIAPGSS